MLNHVGVNFKAFFSNLPLAGVTCKVRCMHIFHDISFLMPKSSKEIKKKLMETGHLGRYLKYVIGEILLIVVGILIAVSMNNWNEKRKDKKAVRSVLEIVMEDLKADTAELNLVLNFYEERLPRYQHVIMDSTINDSIDCPGCNLIHNMNPFHLNQNGFRRLRNYNDLDIVKSDTLLTDILALYSESDEMIGVINSSIESDVLGNLRIWRENYAWFHKLMKNEAPEAYLQYIGESDDYKNRVAYHYLIVYGNYIPLLESIMADANYFVSELENRKK